LAEYVEFEVKWDKGEGKLDGMGKKKVMDGIDEEDKGRGD
jgi:hypothetical protein